MADRGVCLADVREVARREVVQLLDRIAVGSDKSKGIVLDESLSAPFAHAGLGAAAFAPDRVAFVHPLAAAAQPGQTMRPAELAAVASLVILVRPQLARMEEVAQTVRLARNAKPSLSVVIVFAPRKTVIAEHLLESEFAVENVAVAELELDFIAVDDDVLSMEYPAAFREVAVDGDTTSIHATARGVLRLMAAHIGPVPAVHAKGAAAVKVLRVLQRALDDVAGDFVAEVPSQVEALYIIDRSVDLATPLLTQLTYEGLVDEMFGIATSICEVPFRLEDGQAAGAGAQSPAPGSTVSHTADGATRLVLTSADRVFEGIRDLNFSQVGAALHQHSLDVKARYDRGREATRLKEAKLMLDFVRGNKELQERHRMLEVHTNLATALGRHTQAPAFRQRVATEQDAVLQQQERAVLDFIADGIGRGEPMPSALRLACLVSVVNGGLKAKAFDALRDAMQLSYGYPETVAALMTLDKAGLLVRQTRSLFSAASGALGILQQSAAAAAGGDAGGTPAAPEGPAAVAAALGVAAGVTSPHPGGPGCPPLGQFRKACRLWVEGLNEKAPADVAYAYSGVAPMLLRTLEAMADGRPHAVPGEYERGGAPDAEVTSGARTAMVLVVGGVTRAEVSAIRHVMGRAGDGAARRRWLVATTGFITGNSLVESLLPFAV